MTGLVAKKFSTTAVLLLVISGCATLGLTKDTKQESLRKKPDATAAASGEIVHHSGHSEPAIAKLKRDAWVEIRKNSKNAHTKMYAALGAGEWDVAISDARAFLAKNPKDYKALNVLATALAMDRQYALAAYYANLIDSYYPGQASTANLRGLAIVNRPNITVADYHRAASFFRQAFEGSSKEIAAGLNLGHLLLKMGNAGAAAETFAGVKARCGGCDDALMGYGVAKANMRQFAEAKTVFENILEKNPKNSLARYQLALVEKDGFNNNDGAKKHLDKLLTQTTDANKEIKRKANVLLRQIDAHDNGGANDQPSFYVEKPVTSDSKEVSHSE